MLYRYTYMLINICPNIFRLLNHRICNEYPSINYESSIIFLFYTKVNVSYIKNACDTFTRTNQKRFIMQMYSTVESTVC